MLRQKLDEYLDGALGDAERAEVERQIARDLNLSNLVAQLKADRALRRAVHKSYEPDLAEAQLLATRTMAACFESEDAPLAHIGVWVRRISAVAAVIAIIIGSFAMGRLTANQTAPITPTGIAVAPAQPAPIEVIRVLYNDETGDPQMKEFASLDDANAFMKEMNVRHAEPVMVAADDANAFNPNKDGSF